MALIVRSSIYFFSLLAINMFSRAIFSILLYNLFCSTHTYIDSSFLLNELVLCKAWSFFFFYESSIEFNLSTINVSFSSFICNHSSFYTFLNSYIYLASIETDSFFLSSSDFKNSSYITIKFLTRSSNSDLIKFDCLQDLILIIPSETSLVFFRILNSTSQSVYCISLYLVYPSSALLYVKKLQCFCFDTILIFPFESVELPVLFFLDPQVVVYCLGLKTIYFFYSVIVSS